MIPTTVPELLEAGADVLDLEREYVPSEYYCGGGACQVGSMVVALGWQEDGSDTEAEWDGFVRVRGGLLVEAACRALMAHHGERERDCAEEFVALYETQMVWYEGEKARIVQDMRALAAKLAGEALEDGSVFPARELERPGVGARCWTTIMGSARRGLRMGGGCRRSVRCMRSGECRMRLSCGVRAAARRRGQRCRSRQSVGS